MNGILGIDDRPRFRIHVRGARRASYAFDGDVRVGTVVLSAGVSDYDVPEECGAHGQRYTVVNGHTVLVERGSGRIVDVIELGYPWEPAHRPPDAVRHHDSFQGPARTYAVNRMHPTRAVVTAKGMATTGMNGPLPIAPTLLLSASIARALCHRSTTTSALRSLVP